MSRTIRKLPTRRSKRTLKWYGSEFDVSDYRVLRNPPDSMNTNRIYLYKSKVETHTVYEKSRKGVPGAQCQAYDDWWMYNNGIHVGDWFIAKKEEYTLKWRECIWSPNMWRVNHPHPEQGAIDKWMHYLRVHRYAYRNGTCRRQRKNAVRLAKRIASRERRLEDQKVTDQELKIYYEELSINERDCSS